MSKATSYRLGFTIIEILVVITIMLIVGTIMIVGFKNFASYQEFNQAVGDVQFSLNQVRQSARSAEGDSSHGIKFDTDNIVIFVGDTYSAADPQNQVISFELVTLQHSFTGGTDEVVFDKLTGLPSATGTVVVTGVVFSASTTIELSSSGVIQ